MQFLTRSQFLTEVISSDTSDVDSIMSLLSRSLEARALNLTGDMSRDLICVEFSRLGEVFLFEGYSAGQVRLVLAWLTCQDAATIGIQFLIATKEPQDADVDLLGRAGNQIGNSVLVACALDILLEVACKSGVRDLLCNPVDERVADHYRRMGFVDHGTRFPVHDAEARLRACMFLDQVYAHAERTFPAFHRPW